MNLNWKIHFQILNPSLHSNSIGLQTILVIWSLTHREGVVLCSRFTIYRAICESLETIDRIEEASECFCQMVDELVDQENAPREQAEWVTGMWSHTTYRYD